MQLPFLTHLLTLLTLLVFPINLKASELETLTVSTYTDIHCADGSELEVFTLTSITAECYCPSTSFSAISITAIAAAYVGQDLTLILYEGTDCTGAYVEIDIGAAQGCYGEVYAAFILTDIPISKKGKRHTLPRS